MTKNIIAIAALAMLGSIPAFADTPAAPLKLNISRPNTPVVEVLSSLAKQSGQTILADDSVIDTIGLTSITKGSVEEMLNALSTAAPGVSWRKVYILADAPLPDAAALGAQIRALDTVSSSKLISVAPGGTVVDFVRSAATSVPSADSTMRAVYFVSDEAVRAKRIADARAVTSRNAPAPAGAQSTPQPSSYHDQAVTGMQASLNALQQMSPQDRMQVLPQMAKDWFSLLHSMSREERQALRQAMRGNNNGGGGNIGGNSLGR